MKAHKYFPSDVWGMSDEELVHYGFSYVNDNLCGDTKKDATNPNIRPIGGPIGEWQNINPGEYLFNSGIIVDTIMHQYSMYEHTLSTQGRPIYNVNTNIVSYI